MNSSRELELKPAVVQEDGLGCAIASTAFLLGIPYQEAINLFVDGKRRAQGVPNFYCPEIVKILQDKGFDYSWAKLDEENQDLLNIDQSIVFCEQSDALPFGHFLARNKDTWMDPWINLPDAQRNAGFRETLPGKASYIIYPNK